MQFLEYNHYQSHFDYIQLNHIFYRQSLCFYNVLLNLQICDKYLKTIGTKVTKKDIIVCNPKNDKLINTCLLVWDIMGQKGFRHLLKEVYFSGADGVIGTCDLTRKDTLDSLHEWMKVSCECIGNVPTIFLGNKLDLVNKQQIYLKDLKNFASNYDNTPVFLTSAKSGENVELAFKTLSELILKKLS